METMKFKTTLKCPACVAKVKDALDAAPELAGWSVDLKDPARTLTVEANNPQAATAVAKILADAGFRAEPCTA